ncbi:TetR/AcrR family transcriptional regulator [Mycobacteroides abscessus]|uniref:TetR/AcrR family transcriptional regulator n=1 Tax=Mycobacteroides abscessus TaxID=36809 RepID=UPI0002587507|nr:TetR/AcrR family transcriptional regulator [Mycobacteroides abscessus]EIC67010.1 TetR family transcriptional regulator [Mycobacteroides abscessus M93]MBN7410382.1 TetR/AcrR family transcriptional regulator [Mycobacteroides abscessus subsp. abscessus]MBN7444166.1 TetR/AcrR family transcriptional regulator [Mycobacteroides abscessus subsp. abscessus]MBN7449398.1 TetR/AcrR family transcriptional regulator [Mycobacteroides abscessus subsp. abscessus]MBN7527784.1 TetR/AcrR family transcriptional
MAPLVDAGGGVTVQAMDAQASADPVTERILDAALSCVTEFGVRRTTLVEVAKRAGVSRPSVYRRWPDVRTLVAELLTREMGSILPATGRGCARERLVRSVTGLVTQVREHSIFAAILRSDPELLLTYIVQRLGTSQRALIGWTAMLIVEGQTDGSIRAGTPEQMAAMVLLIGQSVLQSARIVADILSPDELVDELATAIDGYLKA